MKSEVFFFVAMLVVALLAQGLLFSKIELVDERLWSGRIDTFKWELAGNRLDPSNRAYPGHPGTTIILIGALLESSGVPAKDSVSWTVAILNALSIALVVLLAKLRAPKSMWWFVAAIILLFNDAYFRASPTNAVMAPLGVAGVLLALWLYENHDHRLVRHGMVLWGVLAGLGLATRWPATVLLYAPLSLLLVWRLGIKKILAVAGIGLTVAVGIDPLLWYRPIERLGVMAAHLFRSAYLANPLYLHVADFVLLSPLAILGLAIAVVIITGEKRLPAPVARDFLLTLLLITGLFALVFLNLDYQSLRYFDPIIFTWEIMLPFFLLHFCRGKKRASWWLVLVIAGGQIFSLWFVMWWPV